MAICVRLINATRSFWQKCFSHTNAVGALDLWQRRFVGVVASVLVALLPVTETCAEAKEPVPNIKDLVGMTNGSNTDEYPLKWRKLGGCTYGRSLILCSMLKNGKQEGMILQKLSREPKKIGESVPALITDAIAIKHPRDYDNLAFYCYPKQSDPNKTEAFEIFAEVRFAKRCDVKTTLIQRAWTMNLSTGKFEQVSNTKDLVCEYGLTFRGEPEFRSGCPGYSPIPSQ